MQNVVDVACSSPPVAMNATKPAAQAVQAADSDPFDLVLQKASERIVNDKQSDRVGKSNELKSTENTSGSDSIASKKGAATKNEREVNNTDKPENSDRSEKTDKSDHDEKTTKKMTATDASITAFGYITPEITVVDNMKAVGVASVENIGEIGTEAIQPANLTQIETTATTKTEASISTLPLTADQTGANSAGKATSIAEQVAVTATTDTGIEQFQESKVETNAAIAFSETLKSGSKSGENTKTVTEPVISDTKEQMAESAKTNVITNTTTLGQDANSNAGKIQEVATSVAASVGKNEKAGVDNTNPVTSPPDTPDGTASVTVQTTSQISEQARLAEAPKNEVISQVANQVDQMVKSNRSSLRMQLYPEELGHIDLRIVTTKDGISVTMLTEKASTQQVLKSDIDVLRQNIEQAGIQLTNLNINQGQNSNRQQAFEHRQNFSNNSYPGSNSENSNSASHEPKKHLTSTVVDYKV